MKSFLAIIVVLIFPLIAVASPSGYRDIPFDTDKKVVREKIIEKFSDPNIREDDNGNLYYSYLRIAGQEATRFTLEFTEDGKFYGYVIIGPELTADSIESSLTLYFMALQEKYGVPFKSLDYSIASIKRNSTIKVATWDTKETYINLSVALSDRAYSAIITVEQKAIADAKYERQKKAVIDATKEAAKEL